MNNKYAMIGLVGVCLVGCVLFACAGTWATLTLNTAADNAESALSALAGDDTNQTARAVCVAGLVNWSSCNVSQTQPAPAVDDDEQTTLADVLYWSVGFVIGLVAIVSIALVGQAAEGRWR